MHFTAISYIFITYPDCPVTGESVYYHLPVSVGGQTFISVSGQTFINVPAASPRGRLPPRSPAGMPAAADSHILPDCSETHIPR